MTAAKDKGTRWERETRLYFREHLDPHAYKPAQEGRFDVGDMHAAGAVFQAKDWRDWQSAIRVGLDGAVKQAGHAGKWPGIALVKRARKPVGEGYAVMRIEDLVRLLALARRGEAADEGPTP
jgi:hypothetical protein